MKQGTFRTVSIVLFLLVTLFYLSPLLLKDNDPETGEVYVKKPLGFWTEKMLKLGLDLQGGMEVNLYVDLSEIPPNEHEKTVQSVVKVLDDRIDKFGVTEPTMQRVGLNKIVIQLPGLRDFNRAKALIGSPAVLEFKLVANDDEIRRVITQLDTYISQNIEKFPYLKRLDFEERTPSSPFDDNTEDELDMTAWHEDLMSYLTGFGSGSMIVSEANKELMTKLLEDSTFIRAVPAGYQVALGKEGDRASRTGIPVYVLNSRAELTGKSLDNAETRMDQSDFGKGGPYVSLKFNREGSRIFERVTGQNIKRQLAVVLDDVVYVAPVIQDRIRGGEAQITGSFTLEECKDIVIVLNAGNLEAPIEIGEERTVGPSLGSDSVKAGAMAGLIGLIAVMVFMLLYYKLTGFIANIALLLNTAFIFAALTFFEATLTLPGIAGIILTIGMAVDANVLIYERIKEELRNGKSVRNAIDSGYARAIVTILDANITTLITAAVLYNSGTGPIRGFAVTLTIGILASMFTSILVTRALFDAFFTNSNRKTLSI